jgi:hypothetical protein
MFFLLLLTDCTSPSNYAPLSSCNVGEACPIYEEGYQCSANVPDARVCFVRLNCIGGAWVEAPNTNSCADSGCAPPRDAGPSDAEIEAEAGADSSAE